MSAIRRWSGVIALEGILSVDDRFVEADALTFDGPRPLLRYAADDTEYARAETLGTIDSIERVGRQVRAHGDLVEGATLAVGDVLALGGGGFQWKTDGDVTVVTAGRISYVAALAPGERSAWADCRVLTVTEHSGQHLQGCVTCYRAVEASA